MSGFLRQTKFNIQMGPFFEQDTILGMCQTLEIDLHGRTNGACMVGIFLQWYKYIVLNSITLKWYKIHSKENLWKLKNQYSNNFFNKLKRATWNKSSFKSYVSNYNRNIYISLAVDSIAHTKWFRKNPAFVLRNHIFHLQDIVVLLRVDVTLLGHCALCNVLGAASREGKRLFNLNL